MKIDIEKNEPLIIFIPARIRNLPSDHPRKIVSDIGPFFVRFSTARQRSSRSWADSILFYGVKHSIIVGT